MNITWQFCIVLYYTILYNTSVVGVGGEVAEASLDMADMMSSKVSRVRLGTDAREGLTEKRSNQFQFNKNHFQGVHHRDKAN